MSRGLNPEDDVPQLESRVEVAGRTLTAEENYGSSDNFTSVSSRFKPPNGDEGSLKEPVSQLIRKRKRMEGHPEEFNNNREYAPQPESRVEVPAHNQRAGVKSSCEYFNCVSCVSKLRRGDEGTLKEPVSQLIRKRNRMEGHPEEFNNNREYAPQPESRVEVPAHNQRAGVKSSCEYFNCVSCVSKLRRGDEGTLKEPVSQLIRKRKRMEGHPEEFYNNREYATQPESRVEVPAHNQRAGVKSSCEYFNCVSCVSKLRRGDEGTLKEPVSQLIRKRKRMEGHPEEFNNNREYAPQPESRVEVPAHNQRAGVKSSCEYFNCVSCVSKLRRGDEGTLKEPVSQLIRKRKRMEGHPEEFYNNREYATQPESRVEVPAHNQRAGVKSSCEYFNCVSCVSKLRRGDEGTLKEPVSQLIRKRKRMEGHPEEFNNNREYAPQPESRVEVPAYNQRAGVKSSCEYFNCVSCVSKLRRGDEEMNRRPLPQDLDQSKISSSSSQASSPSYPSDDDNPSMSSGLIEDERVMTIYYMQVQMKGGVAVLCNTEEGFKPPSKKIKMQKMTYIEKVHKNIPCSHTSVKKFSTDGEPSSNSRAQENWSNTSSPYSRAQPPTLVEYSRVSRPEWLLATKSGFRCMACLRVFPSLEVLREHVEHGVNEGFSCHTFHLTLARLKSQEPKEETEKATFRSQMATYFGLN